MLGYHGEEETSRGARLTRAVMAVEHGLGWLLWLTPDGFVVDANSTLCSQLGYSLKELVHLQGAPLAEFRTASFWPDKWRMLCVTESQRFESSLVSKTGALTPVMIRASIVPPTPDERECALLSITPLDAMNVKDGMLTGAGSMLPSFYEAMSEGVAFHKLIFDDDGQPCDYMLLEVNSQYSRIVGMSRESVIGKFARELYGLNEAPYLSTYAKVSLTGENASFDVYYSPLAKWLHISVTSFAIGYFATIFSDVTERMLQAAERESVLDQLKDKAAELDATIASIASGIAISDSQGNLVRVNAEAIRIIGFDLEDLPTHVDSLEGLLDPRNENGGPLECEHMPFSAALHGDGVRKHIASIVVKSGERVYVTYSSSPIRKATGELLGAIVSFNDVTPFIKLQQTLKVNEARASAQLADMDFLFEHTPVALFSLDRFFRIVRFNQNFSDICANGTGVCQGMEFKALIPDLSEALSRVKSELLDDGIMVSNLEVSCDHSDLETSKKWWLANLYPRKDDNGQVIEILGALTDITERKTVESEWRRNSSLLERAEEIVRMGYWEIDVKDSTVWASAVARDIYGIHDSKVSLAQVQAAVLPEYRGKLDAAMSNLIAHDATYDEEFQIQREPDGAILDVRSRAVYHRGEHKVVGVVQDVTARKAAQATLQKLSLAVEQNPASIVITDTHGKIEYVNPVFTEITGYSLEEAIGNNPRLLKSGYTTPELYDELWSTVTSGDVWRGTLCNKKKNGDLYWESASISPIIDESGRVTHYVAVKEDITRRVNADIELAALNDRAVRRLEYLQAAHRVELAIRQAIDMTDLKSVIVHEIASALKMDAVTLWTKHYDQSRYSPAAQVGDWPATEEAIGFKHREAVVDTATRSGRAFYSDPDLINSMCLGSDITCYGVLPLLAHGEIVAIVDFRASEVDATEDEWTNCLEMIGTVCALSLHNAKLFEEVSHAHFETVEAYDATLEGWSRALDLRDRETEGHSQRVTAASVKLAARIGLSADEIIQVRRGALLHDVGKLGVPDRILGKPGPLNEDEWEIMKMHPIYAYEWLSRIAFLQPALAIPRDHHEHWDGKGYPRGLQGTDIPVAARLFTIIDVWDALTHDRPYRAAWPTSKALNYLAGESGKLFDPELLGVFLEMLNADELS